MSEFILHLLRHGAPEITGTLLGRNDCAPTAAGIAACVEQVDGLGIEAIVASDLQRASIPAVTIAGRLGLTPHIDPRWRELDFGDWDGLPTAAVDRIAMGKFWSDPDANPPPNGERWSALKRRVGAAITELPPRTTLIVTHGGAMRAAVAHLCGFGQRQLWALDLPYAALLTLRVWPGEPAFAQIIGLYS